jgi:hypothetical protein
VQPPAADALSARQRRRQRRKRRLRRERQQLAALAPKPQPLHALPPLLGAHNLSGKGLPLECLMLLNRGLKFAPVPRRLVRATLTASVQRFQRSVRLRCQFGGSSVPNKYKLPNPSFLPQPAPPAVETFLAAVEAALLARFDACPVHKQHNLSTAEASMLAGLKQRHDLVIKPADKNLGLTVMSADAYHAAVLQHVSDTHTYEDVTDRVSDVIAQTQQRLAVVVARHRDILGDIVAEFMLQGVHKSTPSDMYILPKLHKMHSLDGPVVGRPIVACHSWVSTWVSIWLADQLNAVLPQFSTIVTDRTQFIRQLENLRVSHNAWLVTFDVESLYPHVEHEGCIEACAASVAGCPQFKNAVADLLRFVLECNVVTVQGRHYRQLFGGAMGTNCMPPAAQLYLARCWEAPIQRNLGDRFPAFYKRFIDDGFVVFEGSELEVQAFCEQLNTTLPNIKITFAYNQFQADFLDLVVYKCQEDLLCASDGMARLKVRTHQKALNKYLYIPYTSFHHHSVFTSFVTAELMRYVVTNTDLHWYECMVRKFSHRLCQRGFPRHLVASVTSRIAHSMRQQLLQHSTKQRRTAGSKSVLVVPYAQGIPELRLQQALRAVYENSGEALHTIIPPPIVAFSKAQNLGALLVRAGQ